MAATTTAPSPAPPKPAPVQIPGDPCWSCGLPDAHFQVGTHYYCGRSCAEDHCL